MNRLVSVIRQVISKTKNQGSMPQVKTAFRLDTLTTQLTNLHIDYKLCDGVLPSCTVMHNLDHEMPLLVVWPQSTQEVQHILGLTHPLKQEYGVPISVMSGGHGYDGKAMCKGITLDMQHMNACYLEGEELFVQPGAGLRKVMDVLFQHERILPHGDSLTVGVGGHYISAGWDLILTRKYGLGCQHVQSATMVHWDGTVEEVTSESNPELLHGIRGCFGYFKGIVTDLRLQTFEQPQETHLARVELSLKTLPDDVIRQLYVLPREISSTIRFFFEDGQPKLYLVLGTLYSKKLTELIIRESLGNDLAEAINQNWVCHSLNDVRFLPLENKARQDWEAIKNMTTEEFEHVSEQYWKREVFLREMKVSYCQQRSYWVDQEAPNSLFLELMAFLFSIPKDFQTRVYGNVTLGGGLMWDNRDKVSMPVGHAILRFECHADDLDTHRNQSEAIADQFTNLASRYLENELMGCVYSGDEFKRNN